MNEPIQLLDDLGAEFDRVAAVAERTSQRPAAARLSRYGARARTVPITLVVTALLASTAYAVPATRAAVGGIADSLTAWVSGDSDNAPGRAVEPGDNVPAWFNSREGEARMIAETAGLGLYVRRVDSDRGPWLEVWLGEGRGMGGTLESWRERLGQHALVVLGYTPFGRRDVLDGSGRVPLYGLATPDVKRVEIRYADSTLLAGPAGDGGFVLLVDAWRPLNEITSYDRSGHVLEQTDISKMDLRYLCDKDPGACPPDVPPNSP